MAKEIYLTGMTAEQLSQMIRESLRDELRQLRPAYSKPDTKYRNYPLKYNILPNRFEECTFALMAGDDYNPAMRYHGE